MRDRPEFPTLQDVKKASREQLADGSLHLPAGETQNRKKSWIVSTTDSEN